MTIKSDSGAIDMQKNVLFAEPMSKHTTIRIGGKAETFVNAQSPKEIIRWSKYSLERDLPLSVIGNGSNLLVSDDGIQGLVMKIYSPSAKIIQKDETITVFSGYPMGKLINWVAASGLGGIENLAGIPGTIGGAVVMNAGARGCEIGSFVEWISVWDLGTLQVRTLTREDLNFSYRYSSLQNQGYLVLEVNLKFDRQSPEVLKKRITDVLNQRNSSQPINFPNAGSIFKNPPNLSAGRLIEEVGLKGYRIGNAQISDKHGNFIINLGDAKAKDVMELINIARKEVFDKFNVILKPEVRILGWGLKLEEV